MMIQSADSERKYIPPRIEVLCLHSEGVLCVSYGTEHEDFQDGGIIEF